MRAGEGPMKRLLQNDIVLSANVALFFQDRLQQCINSGVSLQSLIQSVDSTTWQQFQALLQEASIQS
jgi:hypothetical protein